MKIFLHIGTHKTGSTSIQYFLWKNRENLRQKYSLLYPKTGKPIEGHAFGHHEIPWSLLKNKIKNKNIQTLLLELQAEIKDNKDQRLLLSSEDFSLFSRENLRVLKKILNPVWVIVYFRRQDLKLEASYKERIKNPNAQQKSFFLDFKKSAFSKLLHYDAFLNSWQEAFPDTKIIPRIYDRKLFPEGNVVLDFLSILGIDMIEARHYNTEANPSLSHLSTLVMRKINEKLDLKREDHIKIVKYLIRHDKDEGSPIKTFMTITERLQFLESYRESNERLFKEWFNTENQFVLSEEEIKFYEEQDRIPKEEIEKMVEDRYRKALTYMMEEKVSPKRAIYPKFNIEYFPVEEVELAKIDVLQADLLKENRLTIGGLVLLKKNIKEEFKLKIKDAVGEKKVRWRISSPGLALKYPDNPKAKNARFKAEIIIEREFEFLLKNNDKEYCCFKARLNKE